MPGKIKIKEAIEMLKNNQASDEGIGVEPLKKRKGTDY